MRRRRSAAGAARGSPGAVANAARGALPGLPLVLLSACLDPADASEGHVADETTSSSAMRPDAGSTKRLPNLVIVFLDDAGYADFGPTGAPYPTPNLERLAEEGAVLSSFHVAQPVCSASRAALLTGSYSNRVGITGALAPTDTIGLADDELTLAELAKSKGYATGIFGKWHLGDEPPFLPTNHGFDEFAGLPYSNDMWPIRSPEYPPLPFYEGTTQLIADVQPEDQQTLTVRITQYATSFIDRHADEPFFLYVPHPQPHVPLFVSEQFEGASGMGLYADVMMELDWSVGEILTALDEHQLTDSTWVIVTSDNGPWLSYGNHAGHSGGFREGKHTVFEGGVRVPCVMRFPQHIPAGQVIGQNLMTIDLLPTFARLIDAELPAHVLDGRDILPVLTNTIADQQYPYFLWYGDNLEAVLRGRWKLHFAHPYSTVEEPGNDGQAGRLRLEEQSLALFDLAGDPFELTDRAVEQQDVVRELTELAEAHAEELNSNRREPGQL